jgi:hypothetical protein
MRNGFVEISEDGRLAGRRDNGCFHVIPLI